MQQDFEAGVREEVETGEDPGDERKTQISGRGGPGPAGRAVLEGRPRRGLTLDS